MSDTENALQQPSKKRAAGREISRDNPGLDDDDEDSPEQELGTFKKASDEVLATRRIVRVRRGQPNPSSAPPAASSNPFAGIKLIPPTVAKSETAAGETNSGGGDEESEKGKEEDGGKQPEPEEPSPDNAEKKESEKGLEEENGGKQPEAEESKPDKAEEEKEKETASPTTAVSSFQQLSSSQNAFTNLSGTGFSTSSFSFGPIESGSGLGFSGNGGGSLFGNLGPPGEASNNAPPAMREVEVETGEENEEAVFGADSVLYEFMGGGWKERGKGEVKINVPRGPENGKARLVMRSKGNYRLILNASLFPDMKLTAMDKKGLSFACINSTSDGEAKSSFSTFALKFRDPSVVEEFRGAFAAHKGKAVAGLKTPENSPKASD